MNLRPETQRKKRLVGGPLMRKLGESDSRAEGAEGTGAVGLGQDAEWKTYRVVHHRGRIGGGKQDIYGESYERSGDCRLCADGGGESAAGGAAEYAAG